MNNDTAGPIIGIVLLVIVLLCGQYINPYTQYVEKGQLDRIEKSIKRLEGGLAGRGR